MANNELGRQSVRLRGIRLGSASARFLGMRVRILTAAWLSVSSEYWCVVR